MTARKIVVWTTVAAISGFVIGWWLQFEGLVAKNRPDGCDAPCLVVADEYYGNALWGGIVGALVVGLAALGMFVRKRRRAALGPTQSET